MTRSNRQLPFIWRFIPKAWRFAPRLRRAALRANRLWKRARRTTPRATELDRFLRRRTRLHWRSARGATTLSLFTLGFLQDAASRTQTAIASASLLTPARSSMHPLLRRAKGVRRLLRGPRKNAKGSVSLGTPAIFEATRVRSRSKPSRTFTRAVRLGASPFRRRTKPLVRPTVEAAIERIRSRRAGDVADGLAGARQAQISSYSRSSARPSFCASGPPACAMSGLPPPLPPTSFASSRTRSPAR